MAQLRGDARHARGLHEAAEARRQQELLQAEARGRLALFLLVLLGNYVLLAPFFFGCGSMLTEQFGSSGHPETAGWKFLQARLWNGHAGPKRTREVNRCDAACH